MLDRDKFQCQACESKPGNDRLHVDHIIPWSFGGTNDPDNLLALCDRCNMGKGAMVYVPLRLLLTEPDHTGFAVWHRFGPWTFEVCPNTAILNLAEYGYWFGMERFFEGYERAHDHDKWERHIATKTWATNEILTGLDQGLGFGRRVYDKSHDGRKL